MEDPGSLKWRKSSFSGNGGDCVEFARHPNGSVLIRDSKDRSLAPHAFTEPEWAAFIKGVKAGEFDL